MNTPTQKILLKIVSMTEIDSFGRRMVNYNQLVSLLTEGIKEEQSHLEAMCNIGSNNPGIKGEDVYETKYGSHAAQK
jgi:hypothetical protein